MWVLGVVGLERRMREVVREAEDGEGSHGGTVESAGRVFG